MTREIRFNAFDMNCVGHQSPGLWAHPRDRSWQYKDLEYWVELAEILERGKFDGLFIADVLGVYDVYHGNLDAALRNSTQIPVNDPLQLVPAMALVTKNLGFGLTASLSFEHPYTFARRLSTLDHLTKGRAGWNIVTSYLDSGAKNIGLGGQSAHDDRYDVADEYMEVCYKLWEGSWEDDAVLRDRARRIFTDPAKVHPIRHEGRYFKVPGVHLSEPSPQRTPVLYQAGASARGRRFAGEHAECVFIATPSKAVLKKSVAAIRESVAAAGRDPRSVLIFNLQTVIVDETDAKAKAKYEDYKQYINLDGALALGSGWMGIDFGRYRPDEPLRHIETNAVQSSVEAFSSADPEQGLDGARACRMDRHRRSGAAVRGRPSDRRGSARGMGRGDRRRRLQSRLCGDPRDVQRHRDAPRPGTAEAGRYKHDYAPGTLREKLFGGGPRLPNTHVGARYRNLARPAARARRGGMRDKRMTDKLDLPPPAEKTDVLWFLPTHGDGRYLGSEIGARHVSLGYLSQIARAADELGYYGVLLPTGRSCEDSLGYRLRNGPPHSAGCAFLSPCGRVLQSRPSPRARRRRSTACRTEDLLINVVTGGDPVELKGDGVFLNHDERYEVTDEFLSIWRKLMQGEEVTETHKHLKIEKGKLLYPPRQQPYPPLYFGGSSGAGERRRRQARGRLPHMGRAAQGRCGEDRRRKGRGRAIWPDLFVRHPAACHRARDVRGGVARGGLPDRQAG